MGLPKDPDDAAAKLHMMAAFFVEAEGRVDFLEHLVKDEHYQEALTLCLTYIDSFANLLFWPRTKVGLNFVEALSTYEPSVYFARIHPLQLIRSTARMRGEWKARSERLALVFPGPPWILRTAPDFLSILHGTLLPDDVTHLTRELWRGTVGHIAYQLLRNPSIHAFGSASSVAFSDTYHDDQWAGLFGIDRLLPALRAMLAEARRRSMASCQWFGNDEIILGDV
jgi:hypothetical protein